MVNEGSWVGEDGESAGLNRKGFTSTNNQIVVSAFGKIWSCNTGTTGSVSDLTMYEISNFRLWAEQSLPRFGRRFVMGYKIHYYILGDGIYRPRSVLIASPIMCHPNARVHQGGEEKE